MEVVLQSSNQPIENERRSGSVRSEALKTLAKLLLYEVESLEDTESFESPLNFNDEISLFDRVQKYEASLIREALYLANGSQTKAAKLLRMNTTTLNMKIKRYRIRSFNIAEPAFEDGRMNGHG